MSGSHTVGLPQILGKAFRVTRFFKLLPYLYPHRHNKLQDDFSSVIIPSDQESKGVSWVPGILVEPRATSGLPGWSNQLQSCT